MLEEYGFEPHMARPLQCKAIASARLKNDKAGAAIGAQLLRAGLLPEAWIAPPEIPSCGPCHRRRPGAHRRRGKKIATTAIARKLLTRVYRLLTDASAAVSPASGEAASPGRARVFA
ncbi:hypothetical protein EAS64_25730 [Trebonia kvetii]|uniref:Uncharacterized protein n=1 Tax=Trebonia kvetii TaxID=2480626 RepID=A0A6P2BTK1_9ACTN|nr:hypothetical protein [Trebonia kvetii]TVZ02228.1 hypothetical protein EAS64_25730 [Trebonia kvetii]